MASEDIEAIDRYIKAAPLHSKAAGVAHDDWVRYYDGLSWLDKTTDATLDKSRNLRNAFNRANAVTAADREAVENQLQNGLTSEELAGGTSRRLSTGDYDTPLISPATRAGLLLAGLGVGVLWLAKKVYVDPYFKLI